jgi:hypothetical protein
MALTYGEIQAFALKHGPVTALFKDARVTMLKDGKTDLVSLFEDDAVRFQYGGKEISRVEFEKIVKESDDPAISGGLSALASSSSHNKNDDNVARAGLAALSDKRKS